MTIKQENKVIKDLEIELNSWTRPLLTINSLIDCFKAIREKKHYQTIQKEVADWYKKYDFIEVVEQGIHYSIKQRGC